MSRIILIETSTALCSTALAVDGKVIESRQSDAPKAHAAMTAPFIQDMLGAHGLGVRDCDAVCVSAGPGSYTGLRVGASTAKGLCFAAGIPLISVGTLDLLARQAIGEGLVPDYCTRIIPMIDARRMEVYTAPFSAEGERLGEVTPRIIEEGSFAEELSQGPVLFIGDGVGKCSEALASPNARLVQTFPHASAMAGPAQEAFDAGRFENCAYFEPFYLKQFTATVSKKKII